jgi:hypothetical protein
LITFFERQEPLRGYTVSLQDLRKLLQRLFELEAESHRRELHRLKERADISEEDKTKLEAIIRRAHTLWTSVHGANGEQFFANSMTTLPEEQLPKEITRFMTGNINPYRSMLNREPSEGFQVILDFSRPPFLDWNNPVSSPTANESNVLAKGDQVWTGAVVKCVEDELRSCRNRRQFFHRPFAYDMGLFCLALPLMFLVAKQLSTPIAEFAGTGTTTLSVMLYVYLFFGMAWTYRIIFSYARWAFPVMETVAARQRRGIHRWVLGTIFAAIIAEAVHATLTVFG